MKSIIFALSVALFSVQALANQTIIIVSVLAPSYKSPMIQTGFHDSSFDYNERNDLLPKNKSMCFIGKASDVCPQIRGAERAMNQGYKSGAHDNMRVISCRAGAESVDAVYELSDDYSHDVLRVERTIKHCL